ncbi:MAG: hypothetical protein C0594_11110 [Marinilabiliales bacterium]|nr:MAG: hypothetical protein C0594_11110 [Marinilabiliales bacterium]
MSKNNFITNCQSACFKWTVMDQNIKPIEIKNHGRRAMSIFKYGLKFIAHALLNRKTADYRKRVKLLSCT